MTAQEFQSAFNGLGQRWKRAYNGDQVELIKRVADRYSFEQFKAVCERLLGASRYAPMVPDFEKTFAEMRFFPARSVSEHSPTPNIRVAEDFLYRVRDNIWATNTHVYIRGLKPSFIIIADEPENELVKEAMAVKSSRIAEIKSHLQKNTYARFSDQENAPMRTLDFSEVTP